MSAATLVIDEGAPQEHVVRKRLGLGFWLSIGWIALIVLAAVLAPVLPIEDPTENLIGRDLPGPKAGPSFAHPFGTDQDALDMFSRTIWGARVSLTVGFAAVVFGMVIGGTLGLVAGYFRGWFDRAISFLFLVLLSFPSLILAILLTSLLERNLQTISVILGVLSIAPVGRLARATTLQFADREFVMAAKTIGAKDSRIMLRELLPNVMIPMGALALLGMAVAIVAEGTLAFLGLSVVSDTPTWGELIQRGAASSRLLRDSPWIALFPIMVLFLTVLALNFAGDRVREYFDVKDISI